MWRAREPAQVFLQRQAHRQGGQALQKGTVDELVAGGHVSLRYEATLKVTD